MQKIIYLAVLLAIVVERPGKSQKMTDYSGPVFPPHHALNTPVDDLPVHPNSKNLIAGMGEGTSLHPDFGTAWDDDGTMRPMGIPYNVVGAGQPLVPITFVYYPDESDPGPWPIPRNPYVEGVFDWRNTEEGDRHMLIVDSSTHMLYETGNVIGNSSGTSWEGGCGAIFDLNSYHLRPETWTSADAAGLPIFPLLIRYDEVERALKGDGVLHHPIRFTASATQRAYIWPARHYASSSTDKNRPPMGLRVRLKKSFDISGFSPRMQVILRTMKKYGMIMADNGSNWFFQGTHDDRWDDEEINTLKSIHGRDFEAVDISEWTSRKGFNPNSAEIPQGGTPTSITQPTSEETSLQNFPNPFTAITFITFYAPVTGDYCLDVFDLSGRMIAVLLNQRLSSGRQSIEWDGTNASGQQVRSGMYIIQLRLEERCLASNKLLINR